MALSPTCSNDGEISTSSRLRTKRRPHSNYRRSNFKNNSSLESLLSLSNEVLSNSADEATSESEFEEHPYSISKKIKLGPIENFGENSMSVFQSDSEQNKPEYKNLHEDKFSSSHGNNENKAECRSYKTRRSKPKCESKNALMARLNRLKKKKYITDLEERNSKLLAENKMLKDLLDKNLKHVSVLKRETVNLQSVIKNRTEIGLLLQCISKNTNLCITSSLLKSNEIEQLHQKGTSSPIDRSSPASPVLDKLMNYEEGRLSEFEFLNKPTGLESRPISANSISLLPENSMLDGIFDHNFKTDSSNSVISDSKNELNPKSPSLFDFDSLGLTNNTQTDFGLNELLRCETPSKDLDLNLLNQEFLFDDVGVCFHIANKRVSLEFCESCNLKASI